MEMEEKRIKEEPSVVAISSDLITNAAGSASHSEIETLHLSLRTCKIRRIENLGGLSNLRELNLSYNLISNIEGLDGLRTLVDLNLSENKITHIENLTALVSLEDLNLSGNRIAHIPKPEFEPLQSLRILQIARNAIAEIGEFENLSILDALHALYVNGNPAADHPDGAEFISFYLPNLEFLDGFHLAQKSSRPTPRKKDSLTLLTITPPISNEDFDINPVREPQPEAPTMFRVEDDTKQLMQNYEQRKADLQNDIRNLEADILLQKEQIVSSKLVLERIQEKQIKYTERLASKKVDCASVGGTHEEMRLKVEQIRRQREAEEVYLENLAQEIDALQHQNSEISRDASMRQESCEDITNKASHLEQASRARIDAHERKIRDANDLLTQAREEVAHIQEKLRAKENELEGLEDAIREVEMRQEIVQDVEGQEGELKEVVGERRRDLTEVRTTVEERGDYLSLIQEDRAAKQVELASLREATTVQQTRVQELSAELDGIRREMTRLVEQKEATTRFMREVGEVEQAAEKKAAYLETLNSEILRKQEQLLAIKTNFAGVKTLVLEQNHAIEELQAAIDEATSVHEETVFGIHTDQHSRKLEIERIEDDIDLVQDQLAATHEQIDDVEQQITDVSTSIATAERSVDEKTRQLDAMNEDVFARHERLEHESAEVAELEENLFGKKEVLNKVIDELSGLETGIAGKAQDLDAIDQQIEAGQDEFEEAKLRYDVLQDELTSLDERIEENYNAFHAEKDALQERLETLEATYRAAHKELEEEKQEVERLEYQIVDVDQESDAVKDKLTQTGEDCDRKLEEQERLREKVNMSTYAVSEKQGRLANLQEEIASYESNFKLQQEALNQVIADLTDIESAVSCKSGTLSSTAEQIDEANRKLEALERELVAKGEQIAVVEQSIAQQVDQFSAEKAEFDEQLRGCEMKAHKQKQYLKKQRQLLNTISNQRQDAMREIETMNVKMGNKEAAHHSELDKLSAALLSKQKHVRALQAEVAKERERLIKFQKKTSDGLRRLAPGKSKREAEVEEVGRAEQDTADLKERVAWLRSREAEVFILLALSGHRLDEEVQRHVTDAVQRKLTVEARKLELAEARAEIAALQDQLQRPNPNLRYESSVESVSASAAGISPTKRQTNLDEQLFASRNVQHQLEALHKENELLKNEIQQKAMMHQHNFTVLEENQRVLDDKMLNLMQSIDTDEFTLSLDEGVRSSTDALRPDVEAAKSMLEELEASYKQLGCHLNLPSTLEPIQETDTLLVEEGESLTT